VCIGAAGEDESEEVDLRRRSGLSLSSSSSSDEGSISFKYASHMLLAVLHKLFLLLGEATFAIATWRAGGGVIDAAAGAGE